MRSDDKKILFLVLKVIADLFSINLSLFLSSIIIYNLTLKEYFNEFRELILLFPILLVVLMSIFKLYQSFKKSEKMDLLFRIATALFIFFFLITSFNLIVPRYNYSWPLLLLFYILITILIILSRVLIFNLKQKLFIAKNIAVVGGVEEVENLVSKIKNKPDDYNLKTVIVNKHDESLEEQLSDELNIYFGFKWLEATVDRIENLDILLIAYNQLEDKDKARLFKLKASPGTKIYVLPPSYDPNFFDPDLTV
jgi:FlaA1/EpsC-like NDP-sugar epimerase